MKCIKRAIKWTLSSALLIVVALGITYLLLRDNIHTVIPNAYYRTAQLDASQLTRFVHHYKIKSIINLRGLNPNKHWYQQEISTSKALGVKHYDISLHAYQLPTPKQFRLLVHLLLIAPKPVAMHCEGGADRTGLASAVVMLLNGAAIKTAWQQISIKYFCYEKNSVGRLVMPIYASWLKKNKLMSTRENFLRWVKQTNRF